MLLYQGCKKPGRAASLTFGEVAVVFFCIYLTMWDSFLWESSTTRSGRGALYEIWMLDLVTLELPQNARSQPDLRVLVLLSKNYTSQSVNLLSLWRGLVYNIIWRPFLPLEPNTAGNKPPPNYWIFPMFGLRQLGTIHCNLFLFSLSLSLYLHFAKSTRNCKTSLLSPVWPLVFGIIIFEFFPLRMCG